MNPAAAAAAEESSSSSSKPIIKAPIIRRRLEPSDKQLKSQAQQRSNPQRQRSFQQNQTIMAGLYDLEETLGKGHFATVKAAKHVFTGERVAVKVIDKTKLDTISQKALLKEVLCMKLVQHPNVVKLYEVIDTSSKMYLVLELGQGDLYDLILKQKGGLPEPQARIYFKQILRAVSYCHKLHVAHRDLKPENVVFFPPQQPTQSSSSSSSSKCYLSPHQQRFSLLQTTKKPKRSSQIGTVKLTDFGFSNKFCPGVKLDTSCGSLAYSAPEILLGDSYDAPAVDIWSLGVILYMLAVGNPPFQEANDSETLTMIMDVKYSLPDGLTPVLKDLIRRMLVRDPRGRATLHEIESDKWVVGGGGGGGGGDVDDDEEDDDDDDEEEDEELECGAGAYFLGDEGNLPLIACNTLSEMESERIFGEMVRGGVVRDVEEVKMSLQTNAYNHITSTYYLLAERYLRNKKTKSTTSLATMMKPTAAGTETEESAASSTTIDDQPPIIKTRKNSHQFEDVVLPSTITHHYQHMHHHHHHHHHQPPSPDYLDLETTSTTTTTTATKNKGSPIKKKQEGSSNSHHPHYYHHINNRFTPPPPPPQKNSPKESEESQSSSSSPPKHCNERRSIMRPHHSHSGDSSSDDGVAGSSSGNNVVVVPSISIEPSESGGGGGGGGGREEEKKQEGKNTNNYVLLNVNNKLKPSQTCEEIREEVVGAAAAIGGVKENVGDDDDDDDKGNNNEYNRNNHIKKKNKRVFLSWFFRKAGGGGGGKGGEKGNKKGSSSSSNNTGANGIYKTRSCAELKVKGCNQGGSSGGGRDEMMLMTREFVGVNNGGV